MDPNAHTIANSTTVRHDTARSIVGPAGKVVADLWIHLWRLCTAYRMRCTSDLLHMERQHGLGMYNLNKWKNAEQNAYYVFLRDVAVMQPTMQLSLDASSMMKHRLPTPNIQTSSIPASAGK